ncbi:MAG: rhomboid family intramembrane serine protease [Chitinophagales bacterium]|nr:rhomboid family intramembrane serine protease [Chitinophagales bacterium]
MIFPIGDDQVRGGSIPIFSYGFIVLNILIFIFQLSLTEQGLYQFYENFATRPDEILQGEEWHTLVSSMFLHGGWMHLIGNMMFLWVFGDNIEATIGNFRFLLFYLAGGVFASFSHVFFNLGSEIFTLGASGAISAVLGAYLVMFPRSRIKMWVIILFRSFKIAAFLFLGFWIVQQLISGIGSLNQSGAGVAWWAHIGGFVFGVIFGLFNRKKALAMVYGN